MLLKGGGIWLKTVSTGRFRDRRPRRGRRCRLRSRGWTAASRIISARSFAPCTTTSGTSLFPIAFSRSWAILTQTPLRGKNLTVEPELRDAMLAAVPSLRAFAISLTGNFDRADDLVQDTLVRALANIDRFERGTNLNAWLFTILRNLFHSEWRKMKREVEDVEGAYAARLSTIPEQGGRLDLADFRTALGNLPADQREALLLIGASGFSYEEAAQICECAVGTIKSRVNRARSRLAQILHLEPGEPYGTDPMSASVIPRTIA